MHDLSLNGTNVGSVKLMPVNLMLQYHFLRDAIFRPYIGAGGNYTRFYEVNFGGGSADVDRDRFGPVAQVGFDVPLGKSLLLNADVKKVWLNTDVNGLANGNLQLDPRVYALNWPLVPLGASWGLPLGASWGQALPFASSERRYVGSVT